MSARLHTPRATSLDGMLLDALNLFGVLISVDGLGRIKPASPSPVELQVRVSKVGGCKNLAKE